MKFQIHTVKSAIIEKALDTLQNKLVNYEKAGLGSAWIKVDDFNYELTIMYPYSNRLTDKMLEHEFTKTLKKVDDKIKIKRLKD